MEIDEKQRLREIEAATSRDPLGDGLLDAETDDLREGWTNLVRLLEDADRTQIMPELLVPDRRPRVGAWRHRSQALGALAVGLMVAVTASWLWRSPAEIPSSSWVSDVAAPEVSHSARPDPGRALPLADSTIDDRWEDDPDHRLDHLSQQIAGVHGNVYLMDAPFSWLSEQIGELHEQMEEL